jgi:hypothetical protein
MRRNRLPWAGYLIAATTALLSAGCSPDASRYTPTPTVAQEALRAALEEWQKGQPAGPVTTYKVPIQVADSLRRPGQKLKSFDILGEVSQDGGRMFQVRLKFAEPEAEEKVQFIVVGIDPLWIFRREDYDMVTHWEHPSSAHPLPAVEASAPDRSSGP